MKNHLFIGLGGQGGKSIAELRKVFEERREDANFLAKEGQQWDFLYIDSSRDVSNNRANWTHFGKSLKLDPASFLYLKDDGQSLDAQALALKPDVSPWIGDISVLERFLEGAQGIQGANQRRRFGRILFASNADRIRMAICEDKIAPLTRNGNQCAIHVFASLAGGTGSGSIVDLVTMLRTQYPAASVDDGFPIFLYLYVTSDDFEEAQVGYFHQNQFATLRDLNALACGRFRPSLLGSSRGGELFQGEEPITQIILSTSLNDRNQRIPLAKQHKIVAESAFERTFAYCSGHLDEGQQKPLTGEDRMPAYPGEPLGNLLRSFRFGSTGMKRWEVPTEEIRELLARDLYVSSFRRLLYQNWSDDLGSLDEKLSSTTSGQVALVDHLKGEIESASIEHSEFESMAESLTEDFARAQEGMKQDGFRDLDLAGCEQRLRERYKSHLGGSGVETVFARFADDRSSRVAELVDRLQGVISAVWTRTEGPLGLAYVPEALLQLQEIVRSKVAPQEGEGSASSSLGVRMEARKSEWDKMTFLSKPFKQRQLAEAHKQDLLSLLKSDLRNRAKVEDRLTLDKLAGTLGALAGAYQQAAGRLEGWLRRTNQRRDQLRRDLSGLHDDDVANKCELSEDTLEQYIKAQRIEGNLLQNTADDLLKTAILPIINSGAIESLASINDEQETHFWERADERIYEWSSRIHRTIVDRDGVDQVLSADLMGILQRRHRDEAEAFMAELKGFIDSATCTARLDGTQFQPKDIRGDENMPTMPRKALVVGLPRGHAFADELKTMIGPLMPAGDNTVRGFYRHDDSTQIRLLFVVSWMAGRFTKVVQELDEKYWRALANNVGGDTAYFTNMDKSGEDNQRPALLLPSPDESRSTMDAALWLGSRIQSPRGTGALIQEGEDRVTLMRDTQEGPRPDRIGANLEQVRAEADIRLIYRVVDSVTGAVLGLTPEQREELRQLVQREEDSKLKQLGAASSEYEDWVKMRDNLYEFLNQ